MFRLIVIVLCAHSATFYRLRALLRYQRRSRSPVRLIIASVVRPATRAGISRSERAAVVGTNAEDRRG